TAIERGGDDGEHDVDDSGGEGRPSHAEQRQERKRSEKRSGDRTRCVRRIKATSGPTDPSRPRRLRTDQHGKGPTQDHAGNSEKKKGAPPRQQSKPILRRCKQRRGPTQREGCDNAEDRDPYLEGRVKTQRPGHPVNATTEQQTAERKPGEERG